jgi:DNA-binding MarR family transcriptional regulator
MKQRRRNSCLEALEHMRRRYGDFQLSDAVTFLYVCENEGVNLRELEQLAGLTSSSASRAAARLATPQASGALAPSLGLIELRRQMTDRRGRTLFLTPAGCKLRDEMNAMIASGHPIVQAEDLAPTA